MQHAEMRGSVDPNEKKLDEKTVEVQDGKERKFRFSLTILLIIIAFLAARGFIDTRGVDEQQLNNTPITLTVDGEEIDVDGTLAADAIRQLPTITELAGVELDYDPAVFSSPGPTEAFIEARRNQTK